MAAVDYIEHDTHLGGRPCRAPMRKLNDDQINAVADLVAGDPMYSREPVEGRPLWARREALKVFAVLDRMKAEGVSFYDY